MRSHQKKRQVVQPDAAPRGDSSYMTGLLHEGKFNVRDLLEPAIFDSLPWAYVMCNWAQILLHRRHGPSQ